MTSVVDLQSTLENLLAQLDNNENELSSLEKKLEDLVQLAIANNSVDEETRKQITDLESREADLEDTCIMKRTEICNVRQRLRRAILDKFKQDEKAAKNAMSTLLNSTFGTRRSLASMSPSMRRIEIENARFTEADEGSKATNDWQISQKELEYDKTKKLGSGSYGDVFKGKMRGKEVAIKKLTFQSFDEDTVSDFTHEVGILSKLRHGNVILFLGAVTSAGNYAIVTEYMPKGSVYVLLYDENTKLSLQTRMLFAKDAALGLNWLHCSNPPILHLDIKSQNLLVDANWTVKVADFGLSKIKKNTNKGKIGSPLYMAPEVLSNLPYDEKADVYSFGILLNELYTGEQPYKNKFNSIEELSNAVTKKGIRPDIAEGCPASLKEMIQKCWNPSPSFRPTFSTLLKSNEFDKVLIDIMISAPNELGRTIWKKHFLEKTFASWSTFLVVFAKELGFQLPMPDPEADFQIQCLKEFLVKKVDNTEIVTLEEFGKALEWFGPLEPGKSVLQRMEFLVLFKGFFGFIETQESEKFMGGKSKGTYLVRFSNKEPGSYAITGISKAGVIKHFRISHRAGGKYTFGSAEYDSLEAIIKAHKKDLYLQDPLHGSKYEAMIMSHKKRLASAGYGAEY